MYFKECGCKYVIVKTLSDIANLYRMNVLNYFIKVWGLSP
jgi:hypothetical protein